VPGWTGVADWMAFDHLDGGVGVERAFTIAYKMTDNNGELWSNRFERFKFKNKEAFFGGLFMMRAGIPPLLAALNIDPDNVVFVPALSSGETQAQADGQVSVVARRCAEAAGAGFELNALSKQRHEPIHGIYTAGGRDAELDKAAYVAGKIDRKVVFVVDDFITRGSTLARIAQAIQASNAKAQVYGVALGKTERQSFWPGLSNNHVAEKWDELWEKGERKYRERNAGK
jgi:hypothetical protein